VFVKAKSGPGVKKSTNGEGRKGAKRNGKLDLNHEELRAAWPQPELNSVGHRSTDRTFLNRQDAKKALAHLDCG
jgi:hypothetical protein